ncbi:MAG TPA: metalloregulator ArsR/SmtB family transcription factor, partial [Chroococcales cyanobacterium]
MNGQEFRATVLQQFARIGQAFASTSRLEILDLLSQGERDVESLANETGLSVANTSRHLQLLKGAHLVECRKDGVHAYYRLANP